MISRRSTSNNQWDGDLSEESSESSIENQLISEEDESISGYEDEKAGASKSMSDFDSDEEIESNPLISEDESVSGSEDDDEEAESSDLDSDEGKPGIKIISNKDCSSEIEKGKCVVNQLKRIDALLKLRIELQKHVTFSNQLPQPDEHKTLISDPEFKERRELAISNYSNILDKLLQLQNHFLQSNPQTRSVFSKSNQENEMPTKKRKLEDYENQINHNHKIFAEYRDSVIQKFDDKTRISSGKLDKDSQQLPVLQQIEFVLNNREKLLKRTRVKRFQASAGKMDQDGRHVQEYDPEIFDDTDFYQQLLRHEILTKTGEDGDAVQASKVRAQLDGMRSKMKRSVDTRASKGRRIRYGVQPKLVNFMAPITHNDTWSDCAKDELFNSLFGCRKSTRRTPCTFLLRHPSSGNSPHPHENPVYN